MVRVFRRMGCISSVVFAFGLVIAVMALMVPWAFHIGGRWTLTTAWYGVGRLRDSTGQEYGLYTSIFPDVGRQGRGVHVGPAMPTPHSRLRGQAWVCTQKGMRIPFDVSGDIYGAWLNADGKLMHLSLREPTKDKLKRHFELHGNFQGAELALDDGKSMFMYLLPDGKLTPARSYTSPVPEKHARVTLEWGSEDDFARLCRELLR